MNSVDNRSVSSEPEVLEECLRLLLKGMQQHVVLADEADVKDFVAGIVLLDEQFGKSRDAREAVRGAIGLLETYTRNANQTISRRSGELTTLLAELSTAIAALPEAQQLTLPISALERRLASVSSLSELDGFRGRLREAVSSVQARVSKAKQKANDVISAAMVRMRSQPAAESSEAAPASAYAHDPRTGLPARTAAEAELAKLHSPASDCQAALFVVRRLQLINSRFGYSRGDQVLFKIAQHLAQEMPSQRLFRWTSCSFLMLASPGDSPNEMREKMLSLGLQRQTFSLEWEGHSALVPVSLESKLFALRDYASLEPLCQALDAFVSE